MTHEQLTVSVAIASWKNAVERADKAFRALAEDQYQHEIAPGRNRIIFIATPDKAIEPLPPVSELTKFWTHVNSSLLEKFAALSPQEWLQRHTAMSDDDYAKDPTRNRLSVLLSRTNHASYHLGQIILAPQ